MKRILAVVLAFLVISAFSVTAFAASSPVAVGERIVTIYSWATGQLEELGTITFEVFDDGSVKVKSSTSTSPNFVVNADGTITLKKTKTSENQFLGWVILGDYDVVSGSLLSDTVTIRPKGDIKVYEMYALPPFTESNLKQLYEYLMGLLKQIITPTTTVPGETTTKPAPGPDDKDPVSPPTGSNMLALGAIMVLSLSAIAVVAKKRHD